MIKQKIYQASSSRMNQSIIKTRSQIGQESQQEGCRVHPRKQNQIEVHKKTYMACIE
jgi:hypothetical protein